MRAGRAASVIALLAARAAALLLQGAEQGAGGGGRVGPRPEDGDVVCQHALPQQAPLPRLPRGPVSEAQRPRGGLPAMQRKVAVVMCAELLPWRRAPIVLRLASGRGE